MFSPKETHLYASNNVWVKSWNPDEGADELIQVVNAFSIYLEREGLMEKKQLPYKDAQAGVAGGKPVPYHLLPVEVGCW